MLHPSGDPFATDLFLAHLCRGLPAANHKLDAESQSVNPNPPQTIGDSKPYRPAVERHLAPLTTLYSLFRGDCCHISAAGTGVVPYEYCLCQFLRELTQQRTMHLHQVSTVTWSDPVICFFSPLLPLFFFFLFLFPVESWLYLVH